MKTDDDARLAKIMRRVLKEHAPGPDFLDEETLYLDSGETPLDSGDRDIIERVLREE
jgi:hypothetical protein